MTKKIVKRTDTNNETLYFYTHSDAVDVGEGSSTKSLTEVIDDTLHKSAQTLTNAEKTQVHANLGTESFVGDRAVRYDEAQVLGTSEKTQALTNLGLNGVDDVPTENSNNVVRSGGVKDAIDDVIDDFTNRGFMYKGIAPVSAPLGEDKTFYIAKSGEYSAYTGIGNGSFTLNGIAVLTYATATTSGAWTKNDIVLFDEEPTAGSNNLVKSGGVYGVLSKEVHNLDLSNDDIMNLVCGKVNFYQHTFTSRLTDSYLSDRTVHSNLFYCDSIELLEESNINYVRIFAYRNGTYVDLKTLTSSDRIYKSNNFEIVRILATNYNRTLTVKEARNSLNIHSFTEKSAKRNEHLQLLFESFEIYLNRVRNITIGFTGADNRATTSLIIGVSSININEGFQYSYIILNSDNTVDAHISKWLSTKTSFNTPKNIYINIRKADSSSITEQEVLSNLLLERENIFGFVGDYTKKQDVVIDNNYFEQGGIYSDGITSTYLYTRIRTKTFINAKEVQVDILDLSYEYSIFSYDKNGGYITNSGWLRNSTKYQRNGSELYKVVIRKADNSDISPSDYSLFGAISFKDENNNRYMDGCLYGKKMSILGDSISTFGTPNQNNTTGMWCYANNTCRYPQNDLLTDVNDMYWKKILDNFGMNLGVNESWRGTRVSWDGSTETTVIGANKHLASNARIQHLGSNGTPDIILIYGGTNDAGGNVLLGTFNRESPKDYTDEEINNLPVNTFADAYRTMIIRILKAYPNSKVLICLPNFTETYYTIENLDNYVEVIKEIADYFGIKYIDLRTAGITIFNGNTYLPDGIHPNADGMDLLYRLLCKEYFSSANNHGI